MELSPWFYYVALHFGWTYGHRVKLEVDTQLCPNKMEHKDVVPFSKLIANMLLTSLYIRQKIQQPLLQRPGL